MNRRSYVVALAATVAFVLGAVTPASAGDLTRRAVARIAAKVVDAKAPSLVVARAATAGDAATLAGRTPDSFRTPVFQYTLTNTSPFRAGLAKGLPGLGDSPGPSRLWTFPGLPPGDYVVSYVLRLKFQDVAAVGGCSLYFPTGDGFGGSFLRVQDKYGTCAASVAVTVPAEPTLFLDAGSTSVPFQVDDGPLSSVTFTRVDSISQLQAQ